MAAEYGFDLYPSNAPRDGTRLVRFTKHQAAEFKATANGTGSGMLAIRASETEAEQLAPEGNQYVRVERLHPALSITGSAASDTLTSDIAHGYAVGDKVEFVSLTGGAGLSTTPVYWVDEVPTTTTLKVRATRADATAVDFTTDITAGSIRKLTTVGGWFTEYVEYRALTAEGDQLLTVSGAGTLAYLARAVMWSHSYVEGLVAGFIPQDPFDDTWRLYAQGVDMGGDRLGAVLWRVIQEGLAYRTGATYTHKHADGATYTDAHDDDRLETAIAFLTLGFDQNADSSSNAWAVSSGDFQAQVGDTLLEVIKRLMESGLYVEMDPDTFELRAWEQANHGRDRTGLAWGAGVIRFQAPTDATDTASGDIKSDAKRTIVGRTPRSVLLAGGQDTYGKATSVQPVAWEGFYPSDADDATALAAIANVQITARAEAGDTIRLRFRGDDSSAATGKYLPFEDILPDDTVTLHSGTSQWDWNEAAYPVAAITIQQRAGGDWNAYADLGASYATVEQRQFQATGTGVGRHTHPPNPRLCDAAVPASEADYIGGMPWTWSDGPLTGEFNNYRQLISGAIAADSSVLADFYIGNGTNNSGANFKSAAAGNNLPKDTNGYLPCTEGVAIPFECDIQVPSGNVTLQINWYTATGSFAIATDTLWNAPAPSWTHITATLTPPATAAKWSIFIDGLIDNVEAWSGTGTAAQNRLNGTSNRAARCDHRHDVHSDAAPTINDDGTTGLRVGTRWAQLDSLSAPTAIVGVWILAKDTGSAGGATWVQEPLHSTHAAADVDFTPAGTIAATDVQAAVEEVAADAAAALTTHEGAADPHAGYVREADANWTDLTDGGETALHTHAGGGTETLPASIIDAKGDLIAGTAADTPSRLAVGTDGHVLTADSTQATGIKWAASPSGFSNPMTTAGDIIIGGASGAAQRLAIGTAGQVLKVNAGATAPEWGTDATGGGGSIALGQPQGTLARSYTFDSTVESWTAATGTLSATGGRLRLAAASGGSVAVEPSGAANVADGEFVLDYNTVAAGNNGPGVVFRYTDDTHHYLVTIETDSCGLFVRNGGGYAAIGSSVQPRIFSDLAQVRVLIRFNGAQISLYINEGHVFSAYNTVLTTGRVGIRGDNGTVEADNVKVYTL